METFFIAIFALVIGLALLFAGYRLFLVSDPRVQDYWPERLRYHLLPANAAITEPLPAYRYAREDDVLLIYSRRGKFARLHADRPAGLRLQELGRADSWRLYRVARPYREATP